jgi:hypothetical protein
MALLRCMSQQVADFVAEVGAEGTITLTLHPPNEAAAAEIMQSTFAKVRGE